MRADLGKRLVELFAKRGAEPCIEFAEEGQRQRFLAAKPPAGKVDDVDVLGGDRVFQVVLNEIDGAAFAGAPWTVDRDDRAFRRLHLLDGGR
jgi:hypothetical protein